MKITQVRTRPLLVPYISPYHWAHGVIDGATVILVEVETDEGLVGYGESVGTPTAEGIQSFINQAGALCIGRSPFENAQLMAAHSDPKTTRLYDRRSDEVSMDEVERIGI